MIKASLLLTATLCGSSLLSSAVWANQQPAAEPVKLKSVSPLVMLQQMTQATKTLDYELAYINISKQGIESLRYRHALVGNKTYAQLVQMDGPRREVVQRDHAISYFDASSGVDPFTLPGNHIIDGLPSVMFADFNKLQKYYDYISVGRARIADQLCDVVRIVSKDGSRYSYVIWLDSRTAVPLRADLLSQEGEAIEQFQVINFTVDPRLEQVMAPLAQINLPPELSSLPQNTKTALNWHPSWLPAGTVALSSNKRYVPVINKSIESRLYADGLFTFSVNITSATANSTSQSFSTGRRTIYTQIRNNKEISVVGEIPRSTAKRIADSVNMGN